MVIKGPNGKGKTTLLSNIVNFLEPTEGTVEYDGQKIDNEIASKKFLYIGENNFAFDNLSLKQNIDYWLSIHNVTFSKEITTKSIQFLFDELNLDKKYYQLSFGQKKKLQLLLLMLVTKDIWVLDDPFNGLDIESISKILTLISTKRENNGTIVVATHQDLSIPEYKTFFLR
jgi:ABC-type multidrug transport system ATPase subunit